MIQYKRLIQFLIIVSTTIENKYSEMSRNCHSAAIYPNSDRHAEFLPTDQPISHLARRRLCHGLRDNTSIIRPTTTHDTTVRHWAEKFILSSICVDTSPKHYTKLMIYISNLIFRHWIFGRILVLILDEKSKIQSSINHVRLMIQFDILQTNNV